MKSKLRPVVGEELRRLRESKNLGIKTVAPKVDVSYTYLSKVENGHKPPSKELVEKLCEIYGADKDYIVAQLGELPNDILGIIQSNPKEVFDLIRMSFPKKELKGEKKK